MLYLMSHSFVGHMSSGSLIKTNILDAFSLIIPLENQLFLKRSSISHIKGLSQPRINGCFIAIPSVLEHQHYTKQSISLFGDCASEEGVQRCRSMIW